MYIFFLPLPRGSFKFHPFPFATFQLQREQNIVKPSLSTRIADTSPPIFLQPSLPRSLYPTTDSTALRFSVCLSVNSSWLSGNAIDWSEFQISRPILSLVLSFSFSLVSNARARNVWSVSTTLVTNVIFGACSLPRI